MQIQAAIKCHDPQGIETITGIGYESGKSKNGNGEQTRAILFREKVQVLFDDN